MVFTNAKPDVNYPLCKLRSEHGWWEIGLAPARFCVHVRAGVAGDAFFALDYCAGKSREVQRVVLEAVVMILSCCEEVFTPAMALRVFPEQKHRPIENDQACFATLLALANAANPLRVAPPFGPPAWLIGGTGEIPGPIP